MFSESHRADGVCPCCGRFVGRARDCWYCDAEIGSSSLTRSFRVYGAMAVLVGLLGLLLTGVLRDTRAIYISSIKPSMNHAKVTLSGRIDSTPNFRPETGGVSFLMRDGTGVLRVSMRGVLEDAMPSSEKLPKGAAVEVTGVLSVKNARSPCLFARQIRGNGICLTSGL